MTKSSSSIKSLELCRSFSSTEDVSNTSRQSRSNHPLHGRGYEAIVMQIWAANCPVSVLLLYPRHVHTSMGQQLPTGAKQSSNVLKIGGPSPESQYYLPSPPFSFSSNYAPFNLTSQPRSDSLRSRRQ